MTIPPVMMRVSSVRYRERVGKLLGQALSLACVCLCFTCKLSSLTEIRDQSQPTRIFPQSWSPPWELVTCCFVLLCDYVNQTIKCETCISMRDRQTGSLNRRGFGKVPLVCSSAFVVSKPTQRLAFGFSLTARRILRPARASFNGDQNKDVWSE